MSRRKSLDRSKIKRVALYARVSTEHQAKKEAPIAGQIEKMKEYAALKGYDIIYTFKDEGISGRTDDRPAFQEMLSIASKPDKPFDAVLVWKFNRFARDRHDSMKYKFLLRRKYKVDVISINESTEDQTMDSMMESFIEIMDEMFSQNLSEDCFRGMELNAKKGFSTGGNTPIGYQLTQKNIDEKIKKTYEINEMYAKLVRRAYEMYLSGIGAKQIAMNYNKEGIFPPNGKHWTAQKILYILKNEAYTGVKIWNQTHFDNDTGKLVPNEATEVIRYENAHPIIIDKDLFECVQARLKECDPLKARVIQPRSICSEYLLSGLLRCQCGSSLTGSLAKSGKYAYYSCSRQGKTGKSQCDFKLIPQNILEDKVIDFIKTELLTEDTISLILKQLRDEPNGVSENPKDKLKNVEQELSVERKKLDRIYDQIEEGNLSSNDIGERIRQRKARINELEIIRCQHQDEINNPPSYEMSSADIRSFIIYCQNILISATTGEKKKLLQTLIDRIIITKDGNNWQGSLKYKFPAPALTGARNKVLTFVKCGRACGNRTRHLRRERPTY